MGKLLAAALVAVIAIEPLRFNKARHMPGARVDGLTQEQADALFAMGHARTPTADEGGSESLAAPDTGGKADKTGSESGTGTLIAPLVAATAAEFVANAAKPATTAKPAAKTSKKK